ncbi:MAG: TatD family hydrolase [Candidatus Gastranaerophilales bacterium]|nr:TatD family hydrolase [Candidatus Gastranaerophilales bacterium]
MIDTHAHIDFKDYDADFDNFLSEIKSAGVEKVVIPGVIPQGFDKIISLAEKYDNLFAAIGVHPSELKDVHEGWEEKVENLLKHKKVVAVGEVGLDYYWDKEEENHNLQKSVLLKQIELAKKYKLPILIHDREAHGDCFDILSENLHGEIPVVLHCFSGSPEFAERCLKEGWYLAFGGVLTFKNAKKMKEVVKITPTDKMLLETDSPYLTPVPHRGELNSPAYVKFVAEEIARIKELSFEDVDKYTTQNAYKIFNFNGEK